MSQEHELNIDQLAVQFYNLCPYTSSYNSQLQRRTSGAPDILCLQEVFRRSEVKDIVDAVSNEYPYYASFEDPEEDSGTQPACTPQEASIAADCQSQFCLNLTNSVQLFNCTVQRCWRFSQLSQSCQSCLTFEAGTTKDTYTHCSTNIFASDYAAPYGVLLLSRHHLSNVKTADFMDPPFRTIIPRGYITAEVLLSTIETHGSIYICFGHAHIHVMVFIAADLSGIKKCVSVTYYR